MSDIVTVETTEQIVMAIGDVDMLLPIFETTETIVVAAGAEQGPAGVSSQLVTYEAAASVSGHRAVCLNDSGELIYADNSLTPHKFKTLGITPGAISLGDTGQVQTFGEMTEAGWSWTPGGAIYLSTDGTLTQTPPVTGFSLVVAFALTATKIFIDIKEPVIL